MAAVVLSDVNAILNRYFRGNRLQVMSRPNSPFFRKVPKNPGVVGEYKLAVLYGDGGGRSADFATAQANTGSTKTLAFDLSPANMVNEFAVFQIANKALLGTKDNGMIVKMVTMQLEAKLRKVVRSVQIGLYSANGSKAMGQATNVSAGVITFANAYEARRFQVGDVIEAAATETGAKRSGTGTVTNVNPAGPTITYSGTISSIGTTDFIFHAGDSANGGSVLGLLGLPAWLPLSAPSSAPFYGVDRTQDTERLGGIRENGTQAGTVREALLSLAAKIFNATQGDANVSWCSLGTDYFKRLLIECDDKDIVRRTDKAEAGYAGATIRFDNYEVECVADPENNTGNAYMLDMSTWELSSLGEVPHIDRADGNDILRTTSASSIEGRIEAYCALGCQAPGHNGVTSLPA